MGFEAIMNSDDGVKKWTGLIVSGKRSENAVVQFTSVKRETGFCFVDGCPTTSEATQALIERIAFIRPTHYGALMVTSKMSKLGAAMS